MDDDDDEDGERISDFVLRSFIITSLPSPLVPFDEHLSLLLPFNGCCWHDDDDRPLLPLHSASDIGDSLLLSDCIALPLPFADCSFESRLGMFWLLWLPFK